MTNIPMTATEVRLRQEAYRDQLRAGQPVFFNYQKLLNKIMVKSLLKLMTNYGPVLGFIDKFIVVNKLPDHD